ncbi:MULTISPECIES: Fic family protein [Methanoculleus]|uniref:Fic family protein n=1 Tax=Methanoculleus TaxID=45989 RepID=UPI00117BFA4A|nr:Fic family protein [Methanoculleus marisnigri]
MNNLFPNHSQHFIILPGEQGVARAYGGVHRRGSRRLPGRDHPGQRRQDRGLEGRLLNPGNLDFVIAASNHIPDPFERAAFVLHGIATGHPFREINGSRFCSQDSS